MVACLALAVCGQVQAHGLAPLLLKIEQHDEGRFQASLKSSVATSQDILPIFPSECEKTRSPTGRVDAQVRWRIWSLQCVLPADGRFEVAAANLGQHTMVVRYSGPAGHSDVALLSASHPSHRLRTGVSASTLLQLKNGVESGAMHLLIGTDHLLFILGLCLWLRAGHALLVAVTAFTIGHSVTLVLVSLGVLILPIAWAELAIAASIVALALKLVNLSAERTAIGDWEVRWLPLAFGLVHGTGFASALKHAGLDGDSLLLMVLGFNLGIEVAQLLCVALILASLLLLRRVPQQGRDAAQSLVAYGIGGMAVFWCLERVLVITA